MTSIENPARALNVYDARTVDLIPNILNRYAISDRMQDLRFRDDGSLVVRLQQEPPEEADVNGLPVNDGPLFVTLRFFAPAPEVLLKASRDERPTPLRYALS